MEPHFKCEKLKSDLYPENGILPGLCDHVVEDNELNAKIIFEEETAGFEEHPASLLQPASDHATDDTADGLESVPFLEKMGVSDPESVNISGRTFTAAALRNLIPKSSTQPDLIVHRGAHPISEYNNPDLFPGMFPMLFPFGIGGFEVESRSTPLSFQLQARHSLNLSDRSFRYHHFYVFVVWNLLQRRLAHIHTSFSCRKSNFQHVAHKITQLSPEILECMRKGHWIYSSMSMLYQPVCQALRLQGYLPEMRFAVTTVFSASHTSFSPSTQVLHIVHFFKLCMVIAL